MIHGRKRNLSLMFIGAALGACAQALPREIRGQTAKILSGDAGTWIESVETPNVIIIDLREEQTLVNSFEAMTMVAIHMKGLPIACDYKEIPRNSVLPGAPKAINSTAARKNTPKPLVRRGNHIHR